MKVRGEIFSGVVRGTPLVEKYFPRLIGLLGFKPFVGTMDAKMERPVDISAFSTRTIDHVLQDGRKKVNAYLAPVRIRKSTKSYQLMDIRSREEQILEKVRGLRKNAKEKISVETSGVEESCYECWAVQFTEQPYGKDIVEFLSEDMIKQKFNIRDGDIIEIEFTEPARKKAKPSVTERIEAVAGRRMKPGKPSKGRAYS